MSPITIDDIKAAQQELAKMTASFEAAQSMSFTLRGCVIDLAAGESYAGLLLSADGMPSHHLVLLPGSAEGVDWKAAKAWAASAGGELPTRREQALLYANLKAEFKSAWYWSGEEHEGFGSYAWGLYFSYGNQNYNLKSYEGQARAVRRFPA
jgi:hypothetical protein